MSNIIFLQKEFSQFPPGIETPFNKMTISGKIADQIVDYIRDNLDKPLDITSITEHFHLSKSTLERIFNDVFRQPVHQFILYKRLEKSHWLIINTDLPIKEIASLSGFHSVTTFTRKFHKWFGITPAALRNDQQNIKY